MLEQRVEDLRYLSYLFRRELPTYGSLSRTPTLRAAAEELCLSLPYSGG